MRINNLTRFDNLPTSSEQKGDLIQSTELEELQIDPKIQLIKTDPNREKFSQTTNPRNLNTNQFSQGDKVGYKTLLYIAIESTKKKINSSEIRSESKSETTQENAKISQLSTAPKDLSTN